KKLRKDYQNQKVQSDQEEKALKAAEQQLLQLQASLSAQKAEIKYPDLISKYLAVPESKIQQDMETVQKAIDELELNLTRVQDKLKEARQGQATNLANLHHFKKLLEEAKGKHASLQDALSQQILENGFSSKQEASQPLERQIDPEQVEQEIKSYESRAELIQAKLAELEENQEVRQFDENKFRELSSQLLSEREAFD